jgi:hypothetical protein
MNSNKRSRKPFPQPVIAPNTPLSHTSVTGETIPQLPIILPPIFYIYFYAISPFRLYLLYFLYLAIAVLLYSETECSSKTTKSYNSQYDYKEEVVISAKSAS